MPRPLELSPPRLEDLCTSVYLVHLYDEVNLIQQLKAFEGRSAVMSRYGLQPAKLLQMLEHQLSHTLKGMLHDLVRQKMMDALILNLHQLTEDQAATPIELSVPNESPLATDSLNGDGQPARLPLRLNASAVIRAGVGLTRSPDEPHVSTSGNLSTMNITNPPSGTNSPMRKRNISQRDLQQDSCNKSAILRLFELVLHKNMRVLDLAKNKLWSDTEALADVARVLWKLVGERCDRLERLIVPKELSYSSTMNSLLRKGHYLTHLTLKRNVPSNLFLSVIGNNCPNLKELDIAGADIVTDFGIICLLFDDPEQIFLECWNREKTVGSVRRSQRAFPHPHFDKPIPDPTESDQHNTISGASSSSRTTAAGVAGVQYLHLKRTFYDVTMDVNFQWESLPICKSLEKLRLENTKVKGDGASVVLQMCQNLFSLGYLVFAAAGLKQVFGYEQRHDTRFIEIFYRGPSDQKLQTIANCCHKLQTMFLGSNSQRSMNASVFEKWSHLQYLTLENIVGDAVNQCLQLIGRQFKGLKIQCANFDFAEVVLNCPNLETLIIQKENPLSTMKDPRVIHKTGATSRFLQRLQHVEITCNYFPTVCFNFLMRNGVSLRSVKMLAAPGLSADDVSSWHGCLPQLETFVLFRAGPDFTKEAVEAVFEVMPKLRVLGDLGGFEAFSKCNATLKRLAIKVKEESWDLRLLHSENGPADDKDFTKLLSLHWFYLTQAPPLSQVKMVI